ncbi:MAG: hypothetical protein HC824_17955 [Synechococcales cyanobacterium RM1_1_8]|nr:hypothetical protein [Synechococcales cyanobacterium RM1_1_8]
MEISPIESFEQLRQGQLDAVFYVGPHGSKLLDEAFRTGGEGGPGDGNSQGQAQGFEIVPISPAQVNFYTSRSPESYQAAVIPAGIHQAIPPIPPQDIPTLSTATALVTRPEQSKQTIALLTWSILTQAQRYAPFYSKLAQGDPRALMSQGLMYMHPGATQAFGSGDPRSAWLRYVRDNKPLQTAFIMLTSTTTVGYVLRRMRRRKGKVVIQGVRKVVLELRSQLAEAPDRVAREVATLRQQQRLRLIDDEISLDIYEQLERMISPLEEQCRAMVDNQRQAAIATILDQLDDCQKQLRQSPEAGQVQLGCLEADARELLRQDRIALSTYLQIKQLTWRSMLQADPSDPNSPDRLAIADSLALPEGLAIADNLPPSPARIKA